MRAIVASGERLVRRQSGRKANSVAVSWVCGGGGYPSGGLVVHLTHKSMPFNNNFLKFIPPSRNAMTPIYATMPWECNWSEFWGQVRLLKDLPYMS